MKKVKVSELKGAALQYTVLRLEGAYVVPVKVDGRMQVWYHIDVYPFPSNPTSTAARDRNGNPRFFVDGRPVLLFGSQVEFNWCDAGLIVERERIALTPMPDGSWATQGPDLRPIFHNPDAITAAMRCYVHNRLGDEVDIPNDLAEAS